jgi:hypothetical protein
LPRKNLGASAVSTHPILLQLLILGQWVKAASFCESEEKYRLYGENGLSALLSPAGENYGLVGGCE